MSIEKIIHRKASDYVSALHDPDAPELYERTSVRPIREATVRMLRGKWTADKVSDGEILRSIIGASSFTPDDYERVLDPLADR